MLSQASNPEAAIEAFSQAKIREAIKALCAQDFLVFQKVELGMEIGQHHKVWNEHLMSGSDVCEMAPRDHGKSESLVRAYALWKAKYDPWVKEILILGADQTSAVRNLDKIKQKIEGTTSLKHLKPTGRNDPYSRTEIRLSNGKTIEAKGVGSPLRGGHPQLIILDDILNEKNSLTPDNRKEISDYFWAVIYPMKDKGLQIHRAKGWKSQIVTVGTAQDWDDLYHAFLKNPGFVGSKMKAIIDAEKQEVLWPERYTYDDLVNIRAAQGPLMFSREYQNEPVSDDTTLFPRSLFDDLKDKDLSYSSAYVGSNPVYMGVDFSVPGSTDGDWTVIFVFEYLVTEKKFKVLNYWRAKPQSMQEQIHQIELWCQRYNVTVGYLEDNMFQKVYAKHFADSSSLPLSGHTVHATSKNSLQHGILGFRPLFENQRWIFPYKTPGDQEKTDLIVTEFSGIRQRKGKIGNEQFHDDIVLAMWHALSASNAGTSFSASW